jgi:hypothetical protein
VLCRICHIADVTDGEEICPNCGENPRGQVKARMTIDQKRRLEELTAEGDIAGLRDYARTFANNPAVSKEANRLADAVYEQQNPFTYSCSACNFSTRERKKIIEHLTDEHTFLRANAEGEADTCESKQTSKS